MSIYKEYREAVNRAARALTDRGDRQFTRSDIEKYIRQEDPDSWYDYAPSAQVNFSSMQSSDRNCVVERIPGSFLYRVSTSHADAAEAIDGLEDCQVESPSLPRQSREEKLYSLLRDWLESRGYHAAVCANSRSGGRWGNPDVTGLKLDELPMGVVSLECVTIEAKISLEDWRYWLFEAVSHKRFAQRAWFAFAYGTDSPSAESLGDLTPLCEYAEKYRIGVLAVFVTPDEYRHLKDGDVTSLTLDVDTTKVEVVWPAVYDSVQPSALNTYLQDVLNVRTNADFRNFGG